MRRFWPFALTGIFGLIGSLAHSAGCASFFKNSNSAVTETISAKKIRMGLLRFPGLEFYSDRRGPIAQFQTVSLSRMLFGEGVELPIKIAFRRYRAPDIQLVDFNMEMTFEKAHRLAEEMMAEEN